MKKILCLLFLCLGFNAAAQTVYFQESSRNPFDRTFVCDQESDTFSYSAFLHADKPQSEAIQILFMVDNSLVAEYNKAKGTSYKALPRTAYKLSCNSSQIAPGEVKAAQGKVTVKGSSALKASQTYLLPIRLKVAGSSVKAEEGLDVIYYRINVVASRKKTARILIGKTDASYRSVFANGTSLFFFYPQKGLVERKDNASGLSQEINWNVPEELLAADYVCPFTQDRIIAHFRQHADGQLWAYRLDKEAACVEPDHIVFGTSGYNLFSKIYVCDNDLYCYKPNSELMIYPLTDKLEWGGAGVRSLGAGWDYPVIFGMDRKLYCVDKDGILWFFPLNERGETGLPHRISDGWGIYKDIIPFGDSLLGIEANGNIWKFKL